MFRVIESPFFIFLKQQRKPLPLLLKSAYRKGYGQIDLVYTSHALKGLMLRLTDELDEIFHHFPIVQHIPGKYLLQLGKAEKW